MEANTRTERGFTGRALFHFLGSGKRGEKTAAKRKRLRIDYAKPSLGTAKGAGERPRLSIP